MGGEPSLVADARGGFWATGNGRLTRLDARGAMTASWTFADDELFGAWSIVPAREGGVWLWGGSTIAWFDGERFRDVIAAPATASPASWIVDVGEAPDGSLWVAANAGPTDGPANQGVVSHWDGTSWTAVCRPQPSVTIAHLAVDAAGGVWVAPELASDVTCFDGTTWSTPPSDPAWTADRGGVNAWPVSLVAADDGSLWLAFGGLGHYQAKAWTSAATDAVDLSGTVSLAAAPDGSAWLATDSVSLPGDEWVPHTDTGIAVAHVDGGSWTVYDSADGLPAPEPNRATVTAVAASSQAVIAATRDGFYRLAGDRWVRVGPRPAAAALAWPQKLLAVSGREAWAATDDGLWHVRNGKWTRVPVAGWKPPLRAFDVARAPDGTLAVATDRGAAVLRDGRWTVLATEEARLVTIADDGAIRVGERPSDGAQTTVVSFRFDGRAWVRSALPAVATIGWPAALVRAPDGGWWLLSQGWGRELHRFDGTSWTRGSQLGGLPPGRRRRPGPGSERGSPGAHRRPRTDGLGDGSVRRRDVDRPPRLRRPRAAGNVAERLGDRSGRESVGGHGQWSGSLRWAALEPAACGVLLHGPCLRPRRHPVGRRALGRAAPAGQPPGRTRSRPPDDPRWPSPQPVASTPRVGHSDREPHLSLVTGRL